MPSLKEYLCGMPQNELQPVRGETSHCGVQQQQLGGDLCGMPENYQNHQNNYFDQSNSHVPQVRTQGMNQMGIPFHENHNPRHTTSIKPKFCNAIQFGGQSYGSPVLEGCGYVRANGIQLPFSTECRLALVMSSSRAQRRTIELEEVFFKYENN